MPIVGFFRAIDFTTTSLFVTTASHLRMVALPQAPIGEIAVRYRFEDCVLDTDRHELRRNGLIVPAASQVLDLLGYLLCNRARTVTKDQLVAAVWNGRAISDSALTTRLNIARKVVGDSGQAQRLIKTMPRIGFRFVGDVHEEKVPAWVRDRVPSDLPSIAVLPFANLSGDPAQDFFGDVIAEDVLTELARLRWLLVIARNSSFTFKNTTVDVREIGRELDVRYVLEGSARHSNGRIRVACRLVDARTALQVWSERYDRKFTDAFDVQDEITEAVIAALVPSLIEAERRRILRQAPETLSAWEFHQRGICHMLRQSADDNLRARHFFQQAVTLQTDFSPAYDGLAWTYLMESSTFSRISIAEGCERSEPLARRAIELDPENAEARARLALTVYMRGEKDVAIAEADRALAVSPNCADAHGVRGAALVYSGAHQEGRNALETYLRLSPRDPAHPIRLTQIATSYYFEGNYRRSAEVAREAIRRHPSISLAYRWLAASLGQLGDVAGGAKLLDDLRRTHASSIDMYVNQRSPQYRQDDYDHMLEGLAKAGWGR